MFISRTRDSFGSFDGYKSFRFLSVLILDFHVIWKLVSIESTWLLSEKGSWGPCLIPQDKPVSKGLQLHPTERKPLHLQMQPFKAHWNEGYYTRCLSTRTKQVIDCKQFVTDVWGHFQHSPVCSTPWQFEAATVVDAPVVILLVYSGNIRWNGPRRTVGVLTRSSLSVWCLVDSCSKTFSPG